MCEQGDRDRDEQHQADREQRDRPEVGAEITPRGEQRCGKQERRQEEKKDQFRIQPDFWNFGNEADQQSADEEQDGIGM